MSRGGGAIHSQILPGKPHHNRILCLLAPLSSVLQHHKTAIVNRRFNHNHSLPVRQTIANFSCAAYAAGCAAYVRQCENKANSVQLSWSWD